MHSYCTVVSANYRRVCNTLSPYDKNSASSERSSRSKYLIGRPPSRSLLALPYCCRYFNRASVACCCCTSPRRLSAQLRGVEDTGSERGCTVLCYIVLLVSVANTARNCSPAIAQKSPLLAAVPPFDVADHDVICTI